MNKKIPKSLSMAFRYSSLYICTIVGAGFAAGRELMTYFVRHGAFGAGAAAFCSIFFAYFLYRLLTSPPQKENNIIQFVIYLFNIIIYAAMLAAAADILPFGGVFTAVVSAAAAVGGTKRISSLSALLMPAMLALMTAIGIFFGGGNAAAIHSDIRFALPSAVAYAAYNIITPTAIFGEICTGKKTAAAAAVISGIAVCTAMLALMLPLYINYGRVYGCDLPLFELTKNTPLQFAYTALLTAAVFTTAVSSCRAVMPVLENRFGEVKAAAAAALTALALSLLGFGEIVDKIYFVFGFAGVIIAVNKIWK